MIIHITMKTPDVLEDSIRDAVADEWADLEPKPDPDEEDTQESYIERRIDEEKTKMEKWFEYSELVTIRFDTEAGTATVRET